MAVTVVFSVTAPIPVGIFCDCSLKYWICYLLQEVLEAPEWIEAEWKRLYYINVMHKPLSAKGWPEVTSNHKTPYR
jgi:hypothetical protein